MQLRTRKCYDFRYLAKYLHLPINSVLELRGVFVSDRYIQFFNIIQSAYFARFALINFMYYLPLNVFLGHFFAEFGGLDEGAQFRRFSQIFVSETVHMLVVSNFKVSCCRSNIMVLFVVVCYRGFVYNTSGKAFAFHWA